ncbi:hypothetical protein AZI86_11345 [Bdellovibrio bacteriovorus]|uniref:Uncharacterized protein n=1 Tax=Bdellovibrio bacteriovorus TaxID=959 RepID=A0A150WLM8_BDEBC|nr:hypothetical protein [Bdellovibrio bacteriovorus]KYG64792.1 hypothetical protein AZI86_11345 [Bdellovibrio bacteriovorus]
MKFLFSVLAYLILLLAVHNAHASYVFVGSGGEGYESEGQIYTRDLYDYDLHKTPWFGNDRDPILEARLKNWDQLDLSAEERDLLLRKLTDLNARHPYLGDDIMMVLEYFRWSYSNEKLVLLEPDEIRKPIDKTKRVSIANRFINSILVERNAFQKLDSKNKIALLLHEAIYSLTDIHYNEKGMAVVSVATARLITSTLFDKAALESASTANLFRNQLRLSLNSDLFRAFTGSYVQVVLSDKSGSLSSSHRAVFSLNGILGDSRPLKEMCIVFLSKGTAPLGYVELSALDKIVKAESYHFPSGTQDALSIQIFSSGHMGFRLTTTEPENCSFIIEETIRRRFTAKKN